MQNLLLLRLDIQQMFLTWPSYCTVCRSKHGIMFATFPLNYFILKCLFSIFIIYQIRVLYNLLEHYLRWNNYSNVLEIKMNRLKVCILYYIHPNIVLKIFNWWILELENDHLFWILYHLRYGCQDRFLVESWGLTINFNLLYLLKSE